MDENCVPYGTSAPALKALKHNQNYVVILIERFIIFLQGASSFFWMNRVSYIGLSTLHETCLHHVPHLQGIPNLGATKSSSLSLPVIPDWDLSKCKIKE